MSMTIAQKVLCSGVTPTAKRMVLLVLAIRLNEHTGRCDPSVGKIGIDSGLSEKQARRWLHKLEEEGYITATKSAGGRLNRQIHIPPLPPTGALPSVGALPLEMSFNSHGRESTPPMDGSHPLPSMGVKREEKVKEKGKEEDKETNAIDALTTKTTRQACRPSEVSEEVWLDWIAHRNQKGALVSASSLEGLRAEAESASIPLEEAMVTAMTRGWTSFNSRWMNKETGTKNVNSRIPNVVVSTKHSAAGAAIFSGLDI